MGQAYHKNRLQKHLIYLMWNVMPKQQSDTSSENDESVCLTQMSAKKGIQMYGEGALQAMITEYEQLENLTVFEPIPLDELSYLMKRAALNAIDLIKLKRTGKLKGRTVADGRKQRPFYDKGDTSSPALTQDGFFASLAIDAKEKRYIATADIAGAFLKAKQKDFVVVRLQGPAVEALLRINADKYQPHVIYEKGKKVIYVRLLKAMYGTLTAPLLWYNMFSQSLTEKGFAINPYDLCVANKMINGKQMTICWYVDDLKVSHEDPNEVKKMISTLENEFGKMNVKYGDEHTYLGMDLTIKDSKITVMMKDYLQEAIDSFGEDMKSPAKTPSTKALLEIDDESELLGTAERSDMFHHIVAKLLHVAKRARLDIQPTVIFLCRRVRQPTIDDWKKLKRLLQYIPL